MPFLCNQYVLQTNTEQMKEANMERETMFSNLGIQQDERETQALVPELKRGSLTPGCSVKGLREE